MANESFHGKNTGLEQFSHIKFVILVFLYVLSKHPSERSLDVL